MTMPAPTQESTLWTVPPFVANGTAAPPAPRRLRGLRMPVLPTWPLVAQVGGAVAALWGVYEQWGSSAVAIAGGAAAVVVGMLREAGKI